MSCRNAACLKSKSTDQEYWSVMTETLKPLSFLIGSNCILFFISLIGTCINCYLFYKFVSRKGVLSGFYKLCLVKTVPNFIVCISFLLWAVPLGSLQINSKHVPRSINVLIGQLSGSGAFLLGPLLQVSMASNRFISLYFAVFKARKSKYPVTSIWIGVAITLAVIYTVVGLPEDCGFLYIPEEMLWISEEAVCSQIQYDVLFYTVLACSIFSNTLNITTASKLVFDKVAGISATDSQTRRRMYVRKFSQCVLQDCLHAFDMINCSFTYQLNLNSVWLQFMCFSVSFVGIHTLDGLVMLFFHTDVQPKWLRKTSFKNSNISVAPVSQVQ